MMPARIIVRLIPWIIAVLAVPLLADDKPAPLTKDEQELVRQALWGTGEARAKALEQVRSLASTSERVRQVEEVIRAGRSYAAMAESRQTVTVAIDGQSKVNVLVQLPPGYDPARRYPLMIAIGGGPPASEQGARSSGKYMLGAWTKPAAEAGWIVTAVEDTVSVRLPGKELRYHILHADHLRSIRDACLERYSIDPARIHVTGISLGSNYALAYAAAHPDWFAGIAPVSTEGESREHVVRNLRQVGVYVLEGAKDKNIRTIDGPRKLAEILKSLGYPHIYEEDPKRGHEGFVEKYPQVLKWLAERPRPAFPREFVRLPHPGIVAPGKRFYWLEGDTAQGAFTARLDGNTIDVQAARVRRLTFHLSDRLLNLDAAVIVRINGKVVHDQRVKRSLASAVEDAVLLNDTDRFATARITVDVPNLEAGEKWLASLAPRVEPSKLPFWEDFAMTTLKEERRHLLAGMEFVTEAGRPAAKVTAVPEGAQLRTGDLIVQFDGEPLQGGSDSIRFLRDYLLQTRGKIIELTIIRDGKTEDLMLPVRRQAE
jgi:poly(3-hydroxybutyrate) depolymerase